MSQHLLLRLQPNVPVMIAALKDKFVQKALLEQSQIHFVAQMENGEKASVLESVTADIGNAVHNRSLQCSTY